MYGESKISLVSKEKNEKVTFTQVWVKSELFDHEYMKPLPKPILAILERKPDHLGKVTSTLAFNVETYCQANGKMGISRVVLVNETGERVFDT